MWSSSGKRLIIQRDKKANLKQISTQDGTASIDFSTDAMDRIISAQDQSGRTVQYEYDSAGRLAHVRDSENGDEFYEYDPTNRLTAVLDAQHHPLLVNQYGFSGEMLSQTLADGSKFLYTTRHNTDHNLEYEKMTLPNGYTIEWLLTRNGLVRSLPQPPMTVTVKAQN